VVASPVSLTPMGRMQKSKKLAYVREHPGRRPRSETVDGRVDIGGLPYWSRRLYFRHSPLCPTTDLTNAALGACARLRGK
jgi:hypothetical protein